MFILILTLAFIIQTNFAQDDNQMKGADKILFTDEKNECFVFEKFVVTNKNMMTNNYKTGELSQRIEAFKRISDVLPKDSCQKKGNSIFVYESKDEVNFVSIDAFGDLILVDLNLTPDWQKILIFNGLTGKQIFTSDFTEWGKPARLNNNVFYFDDWTKKEGAAARCPQGKKWKKEGLGVNWIQPYKLDLKTMRKTTSGLSYCVSVY
jgi:hypothetical protein